MLDRLSMVKAYDAAPPASRWAYDPQGARLSACCDVVNRGVASGKVLCRHD
jgi:hypothetical protein